MIVGCPFSSSPLSSSPDCTKSQWHECVRSIYIAEKNVETDDDNNNNDNNNNNNNNNNNYDNNINNNNNNYDNNINNNNYNDNGYNDNNYNYNDHSYNEDSSIKHPHPHLSLSDIPTERSHKIENEITSEIYCKKEKEIEKENEKEKEEEKDIDGEHKNESENENENENENKNKNEKENKKINIIGVTYENENGMKSGRQFLLNSILEKGILNKKTENENKNRNHLDSQERNNNNNNNSNNNNDDKYRKQSGPTIIYHSSPSPSLSQTDLPTFEKANNDCDNFGERTVSTYIEYRISFEFHLKQLPQSSSAFNYFF